jgi:hypothetical protein
MSAHPATFRAGGFVLTVLGALLLGVGSVLVWLTVHLVADTAGVLDQSYPGLDLWEGKVALACAVALVVGALVVRVGSSDRGRRVVAASVIAVGALAVIVALVALLGERTRLQDRAVEDMSAAAGGQLTGVQQVADLGVETTGGIGVFLAIAGGVVAAAGGTLGLARTPTGTAPVDRDAEG